MDWTSIIMTLITSGAFTAIYMLGDKKTSSVLDNVSKTIDQWQELLDEVKNELTSKTSEFNERMKASDDILTRKDAKIDALYKEISVIRDEKDKLSSKIAYLTAYRCNKVGCVDREPPFGSGAKKDA